MAAARPLFVGFSSASKTVRQGGDLEVTVQTARGPVTFTLPWFFVRDVDALLERWRREEHEAVLLTMNDGLLGETLRQAAHAGGLRDVTFLLARGADVNNGRVWPPLWYAARNGHLAVATVLLDAGAEQLDGALHLAATGGSVPVGALLLDRGADITSGRHYALYRASFYGHLEFVRLLLDRGAAVNGDGGRPLRWARERGHEAVIALLRERGAVDI